MRTAVPAQSLTERFAFAVELVLRGFSLSLPRSREVAPLAIGTWNRLKRLVARFSALVAAVEAGRFAAARRVPSMERRKRRTSPESQGGARRAAPAAGQVPPPRAYGWLLTLAPELNTRIGRAQIETLLGDPALLDLLARAPQAGRILRPLCHMLRIEPPECLRLPPRHRHPRCLAAEEGERKPARVPRPLKPAWLRWPKSPPLPGLGRTAGDWPPEQMGTGPPGG